jgi:replicative DNA helicase
MYEELQVINHWVKSKSVSFLRSMNLDASFFFAHRNVVDWINQYVKEYSVLPTNDLLTIEFKDKYEIYSELENIDYLCKFLIEQKVYTEFRPIVVENAKMLQAGKTLEAVQIMRSESERVLKKYSGKLSSYDWVKMAQERFDVYMSKHGNTGLNGLATGIESLDKALGGIRDDDLVLITARVNEGKSYFSTYLAYCIWKNIVPLNLPNPVVMITTEMPQIEVAYRLDTLYSHLSNTKLNTGGLEDPEDYRSFLKELSSASTGLIILTEEDNKGKAFSPKDIMNVIETHHPCLLVIDQLYDLASDTGETRIRERIVDVSNDIRDINLATRTPTIWVAQSGRESAKDARKDPNATPDLHQVQESDAPAQKSTRVISLRQVSEDITKATVKKNRGGRKNIDLFFRTDYDNGFIMEADEETVEF